MSARELHARADATPDHPASPKSPCVASAAFVVLIYVVSPSFVFKFLPCRNWKSSSLDLKLHLARGIMDGTSNGEMSGSVVEWSWKILGSLKPSLKR